MPFGALERMLLPERHRQRAAPRGGFSTPGLMYVAMEEGNMPFLATNMRGRFLPTRRNAEGLVPMGFTHCPIGSEGPLLNLLHHTLWELSHLNNWGTRCSAVPEAVDRLRAIGVEPKSLIVSESQVASLSGPGFDLESARRTMAFQGFVTVVDGMQLLLSDLEGNRAFVAGSPSEVGIYTRVGDHLGMLLQRINRVIMVVSPDVA